MAYKVFDDYATDYQTADNGPAIIQADGAERIELPDSSYIRDADISRDGMDLVLETPEGTIVIEDYFTQAQPPALSAPNGMMLTPDLVQSFIRGGNEYADAGSMNDASPVGAIQEISGEATVTRLDGTVEVAGIGTPIYQGDVVETSEDGAVNIVFVDNTSFAISEDARLAIDEYVFDPATQSGSSNFSVLKGVFVFTSGLIGRDDPDQVEIDTPSGSIGIRGTIIAGDVDSGEITVIEGAIVLRDFSGNMVTLSNQFETAKFIPGSHTIEHLGELSAENVSGKFASVSTVSADLFSSIQDSSAESEDAGDDASENAPAQDGEAVEGAAEDEVTEQGSVDNQMINSTDIINAGAGGAKVPPPLAPAGKTAAPTSTTASSSGSTDPSLPPPPPEPLSVKPFHVAVQKFSVNENTGGSPLVAVIQGQDTNYTTLQLTGLSTLLYNVVRIGNNSFEIYLKPGVTMDYEHQSGLTFHAANADGSRFFNGNVNLAVVDVNETAFLTNAEPDELFTASDNNSWSHKFAIDFHDPEGQIVSYQISGVPANGTYGIVSQSFDTTTGVLSLQFDGSVADATMPTITVDALDSSSNVLASKNVDFDTYAQTTTNTVLTGTGDVYSSGGGASDTIVITGGGSNYVFTDEGDDNITLSTTNNNFVNAGHGNDTIGISSSANNTLIGGGGNDTFMIDDVKNDFYGGEDDDTFVLNSALALSEFQSVGSLTIDGGSHSDMLRIAVGGNLDFTAVTAGNINNIEKIHTNNGLVNTVSLNYADVFEITGNTSNTLIFDMDASDSLTFDTQGNDFVSVGSAANGYHTFTNGTVTLLVDAQATVVFT